MKKTLAGIVLLSCLTSGCASQVTVAPSPTPTATQPAPAASSLSEDDAILAVNALMSQQKFEAAIAEASKALEQYPDSYSLLVNRASVYAHTEQYQKAEPDLVKALELSPPENKWTILSLTGRCAAGQGHCARAEREFKKAAKLLSKDPNPTPAFEEQLWRLRADNLLDDLYFKESVDSYNKALKIEPDQLQSLMGRALAYSGMKDKKSYQKDLTAVEKLDPKAADFLREQVKGQEGMSDTAEGLTKKGLERLRAGQHSSAILLFERAIAKDPKFYLAHEKKGSSLQSLEKYPEAIEAYSTAYELKPNEVSLFNRAICYLNLSKNELAKADLEQFLVISKSPPEIEKAKKLLEALQ